MMLHNGNDDLITRLNIGFAISTGNQIETIRRPFGEDDFIRFCSIDEPLHLGARSFVLTSGPLC